MDIIPILLLALAGALALFILTPKGGAPVPAASSPSKSNKNNNKKKKQKKKKASSAPAPAPAPAPEPEPEPAEEKPSKNAIKKAKARARARARKEEAARQAKQAAQAAKKAARKNKKNKAAAAAAAAAAADTNDADVYDAAALEAAQLEAAAAAAAAASSGGSQGGWESVSDLRKRKKQSPKAKAKGSGGPTVRKTIDVGDKIPALMGRGGSNVKAIRDATGADINIPRREENSTVVKVSGSAAEVNAALQAIRDSISGGASPREDNRDSRTMQIAENEVRLVIGRFGSNIKLIESETGASVNVSKEGTPTVTIRGDGPQLDAAQALIEKVIEGRGRLNGITETIPLRDGQARIIIGPKGATVNAMKDSTGAQLNIKDDHVDIFGTPEQVKLAATAIARILADFTTTEMEVDGRQCGTIIGSKGSTINKLQDETGASIKVDNQTNVVTISGPKASVGKAHSRIVALLAAPRTFSPLPDGVSSETMELGKHASRVIGRKGATVQKITSDTGAKLDFIEQTCRISGNDEQVAAAVVAVQDILDKEAKREAEREKRDREREERQAAAEAEAAASPELDEEDQLGDDEVEAAADW